MTNAQLSLTLWHRFGRVPVGATVGLLTLMVFASGFGVSRLIWRPSAPTVTNVPLTDYGVALPEGDTTITVSDPLNDPNEIVKFTVTRRGNQITGVPHRTVRLPARAQPSDVTLAFFRAEMTGVYDPASSPSTRANAIRQWLFTRSPNRNGPGLSTRDAREAYLQMRAGVPVLCGNLADIYVGLAQAAGLEARTVSLSLMIRDDRFGADTHVTTEVWLPEFGGWVVQDPTFNCLWEVEGKPASALTLHRALLDHRSIERGPRELPPEKELLNYYIDPRLFFSHLYYEYRVGGELLYYLDRSTEPIDPRESNWIQSDDEELFQSRELAPAAIDLVQGEIAPGIFVQMIKDTLFVHDRRPQRRGIRVRSTSGPVQACAYVHGRAETMGLFDRPNFVRNASLQRASRSEQVADNWSVDGPIEGLTISGGQGVGAGPGGQLYQTFRVEPNRSYVMYALVNVLRGRVEWRLTDPVGKHGSTGRLDPGRIEEVLSDAVVSDGSGQLRVEFTAPEGGGFRVLDVIVCKLPRGNAAEGDVVIRR